MSEDKLKKWYVQYGKLSAPFLQNKLKIGFKEAMKLIEAFRNDKHQIETCQYDQNRSVSNYNFIKMEVIMLKTLTFYLDESIHKNLKAYCVENNFSMKEIAIDAIKQYLASKVEIVKKKDQL